MLPSGSTILLATTRFPPEVRCGVEQVADGLSRGLAEIGYKVVVVTSGDVTEHIMPSGDIEVFRHKAAFRGDGWWWMFRSFLRFMHGRRVWSCRSARPAGIICNSPQYVPWARMFFPDTPILFICHGCSEIDKIMLRRSGGSLDLKTRIFLKFSKAIAKWQEKLANRMTDRLVVFTEGMRDRIVHYSHVPVSKMDVIANGIDVGQFGGESSDNSEDIEDIKKSENAVNAESDCKLRICFVGRLTSGKNVQYLVRALALMANNPRWICRIVGDGDQRDQLREIIDGFGLSERVLLTGWCSDMKEVYDWADIFVLPSKLEGLSIAVLEAMASGLACIGLRPSSGILVDYKGIIEHGVNGMLVDAETPDTLKDALLKLVNDRKLCEKMGAASRKIANADFTWTTIAAQYSSLLMDLSRRDLSELNRCDNVT